MAKKTKLTKEDIKGPDSFIAFTDKVANYLEKNSKPIFVVIGLLFLAGVGKVGVDQWGKAQEAKAAQALYGYEAQLDKKQKELDEAAAPKIDSKDKVKAAAKTPDRDEAAEFESHFKPILSAYRDEIRKQLGTNIALIKAIDVADRFLKQDQFEEAKTTLQMVVNDPKKDTLNYGLVHSLMGTVLADSGDCDTAVGHFDKVVSNKGTEFLHADALLKKGVCYEKVGKQDTAQQIYKQIAEDFSSSAAAQTATNYLRWLTLKK